MKTIKIVYWQNNGVWLGYLHDYPDYWTQGETLDNLHEHLQDLYGEIIGNHVPGVH